MTHRATGICAKQHRNVAGGIPESNRTNGRGCSLLNRYIRRRSGKLGPWRCFPFRRLEPKSSVLGVTRPPLSSPTSVSRPTVPSVRSVDTSGTLFSQSMRPNHMRRRVGAPIDGRDVTRTICHGVLGLALAAWDSADQRRNALASRCGLFLALFWPICLPRRSPIRLSIGSFGWGGR